ncbi:MAG: ankyrin repeat domain-containing protein [Vicinamibacteria bacterium]
MIAVSPHNKKAGRVFVRATWLASFCLTAACLGSRPTTDIVRAIEERDDATLQALLKAGGSPEGGEPRPIIWAARSDNSVAIRLLANAGAKVNRPSGGNNWTPLQHAVHKRAAKAVAALLKAGADPNQGSPHGPSALMMAAGYGDRESFNLLIEGGANASFEVQPGINALWASLGGGAIVDITDGPSLGTCFPEIVAAVRKQAPALRIQRGLETRALRFLAKKGCADLIEASF